MFQPAFLTRIVGEKSVSAVDTGKQTPRRRPKNTRSHPVSMSRMFLGLEVSELCETPTQQVQCLQALRQITRSLRLSVRNVGQVSLFKGNTVECIDSFFLKI